MTKRTLTQLFLVILTFSLYAQENPRSERLKALFPTPGYYKEYTELPSGKFDLKIFSEDSIPLLKGPVSAKNPEIRDGQYYFLNESGRIKARGKYTNNYPSDIWSYYDNNANVIKVVEYNEVWDFLQNEANEFAIDSLALAKLKKRDKEQMNEDGTFSIVEKMPTFQKGDPGVTFAEFVNENIQYPAYNDAINLDGDVTLEFIIDSQGRIRKPQVILSPSPDLGIEAMRLLTISPPWEPGMQGKTRVPVILRYKISFVDPDHPNSRFYIVENMPRFLDQDPAVSFPKYLEANLRYPAEAAEADISGRLLVQFTIMPDGRVDEVSVIRGVHHLLDDEVLRVVSSSPNWTPGTIRGMKVAVVFTFPIHFAPLAN